MPRIQLAEILQKKHLSKRQFSIRLGVKYHSVFQFFKPAYNPTFKMMCRWAKAADCRVRDLIGDDLKPISSKPRDVSKKTRSNTSRNTG